MRAEAYEPRLARWTPPGGRGVAMGTLVRAWNRPVSAPTVSARVHDLTCFGAFAWRFRNVLRTCAAIVDALQDGASEIEALANAWDDEQRENGLARETRERRRTTLRSFVTFCARERIIPRGVTLAPLARDALPRGSIAERVDGAIAMARARGRIVDAALVALLWERGCSMAEAQRLTVGDLPLFDVSSRTAAMLSFVAGERSSGAWIFRGRSGHAPLDGESIRHALTRYGLPGIRSLHRARARRLRELGNPTDEARALAGEG